MCASWSVEENGCRDLKWKAVHEDMVKERKKHKNSFVACCRQKGVVPETRVPVDGGAVWEGSVPGECVEGGVTHVHDLQEVDQRHWSERWEEKMFAIFQS